MARRLLRTEAEIVGRVEEYAEQILDLAAEERRLLKVLARIRATKAALIAGLAKLAKAAANVQR